MIFHGVEKDSTNSVVFSNMWFACCTIMSVRNLHDFKDLKYHIIILICAHMAQNSYFPVSCKMCLMGDIQAGIYFSKFNDLHLLRRGIRILSYALFETPLLYRLKILPFLLLIRHIYNLIINKGSGRFRCSRSCSRSLSSGEGSTRRFINSTIVQTQKFKRGVTVRKYTNNIPRKTHSLKMQAFHRLTNLA